MTRLGIKECPECGAWKAPDDFAEGALTCRHCASEVAPADKAVLVDDIAARLGSLRAEDYNQQIAEYLVEAGVRDA